MMKRALWTLALAASLISLNVSAQEQQQPSTDVNKDVEDWAVRCFKVKSMAPCDMFYALGTKDTQQTIVTISVAHFPSRNQNAINIRVPLGMAIQKGLVIESGSFKSPVIPYRRCNQSGCFVEGIVPNDILNGLKRSGSEAKLKITPYGGKEVVLPISLKGFNAAYSEMTGLSKQRATSESSATAPAPTDSAPAEEAPAAPAAPTTP